MGKIETERALIGVRLTSFDNSISFTNSGVTEDMFFDLANKKVVNTILSLEHKGEGVDLVTVSSALKEAHSDMGTGFLIEIVNSSFTAFSVPSYIKELKKERRKQELLNIAEEIKLRASNGDIDSDVTFDFANKIVNLSGGSSKNYTMDGDRYEDLVSYLESRKGKDLFGYSFGSQFKFLDEYTKGIQKGRTYRIGAPSNAGKTQCSYSFINSLISQGAKVAFFTLENDKNMTLTNLCANYQGKSVYSIERGETEIDTDYLSKLKDKFFLIDDTYDLGEIFSRCLEIKPDVVVLDYIGLVNIRRVDEDAKYTDYSKKVQEFVKRERMSWIDLSNLPKAQEDEESIKAFGGFYGSSFLKNNADVCIHMWRNTAFADYKNATYGTSTFMKVKDKAVVNIMITKNRIGTARMEKSYKVHFDEGGRMEEASEEELKTWATGF